MEERQDQNSSSVKISVRNVLRTLSVVCIAFVFCPTFLISCSDREMKISAMKIVQGIESYGKSNSGEPFYIVTLLLPLTMLIILFIKKIMEKSATITVLSCAIADLSVWFLLREAVKSKAEKNYCDFKSTIWFTLCIISLFIVIIISLLILFSRLSLETNLLSIFSSGDLSNNLGTKNSNNAQEAQIHNASSTAHVIDNPSYSFTNGKEQTIESDKSDLYDKQTTPCMYLCPECKKIFKVKGENKRVKCSHCSTLLLDMNTSFDNWNKLGKEDKEGIKKLVYNKSKEEKASTNEIILTSIEDQNKTRHSFFEDGTNHVPDSNGLGNEGDSKSKNISGTGNSLSEEKNKRVVIVGSIVFAAILLGIPLSVYINPTIDMNEYLTIETSGYDGYGSAEVNIDWDTIESKYGSRVRFTKLAKEDYGALLETITPMKAIDNCVSVRLDQSRALSNGDVINYIWNVNEDELSKYVKCKIIYDNSFYEVSDLEAIGTFDAFSELAVKFSGVSSEGEANIIYNGTDLSPSDFSCDRYTNLSNGDRIKVYIDRKRYDSFVENLGKVPEAFEKEYVVEGLSSKQEENTSISYENNVNDKLQEESNNLDFDNEPASSTVIVGKVVAKDLVNIRDEASLDARKLGVAYVGDEFELIEISNGWCKILYNGKDAYMMEEYVDVIY